MPQTVKGRRFALPPTLAGACAVLIWGSALPIVKVVEEQIGLLAFMGFSYAAIAGFGLLRHILFPTPLPGTAIFRNRDFYARWLFFVLHEGLLTLGISLVAKRHMPFLILINYLWPTAIIVCSVLLAVVTVRRWWAFLLGSAVVLGSLCIEALQPTHLSADLFARKVDCVAYGIVLTGAIAWGMYSALSRKAGEGTGGAAVLPLFQATLALALPVSFLPGMATWHRLTLPSALLLGTYCFLLFLAFGAWDLGMRQGNLVLLSLSADLIPWLSLLFTSLLLHIPVTRTAVLSALVLVSGAMITRFGTTTTPPAPAAFDEPGL